MAKVKGKKNESVNIKQGELPGKPTEKKLTPKQKLFCDEYLKDLNATQAAIRAGYSEKTAEIIGFENLRKPNISAYIGKRIKDREKRTEITQDRVLQEYARIAFLDIRKFFNEDGTIKSIIDLDDDTAAAIAGMDVLTSIRKGLEDTSTEEITKKIKAVDKKGALDSLAKHLGMFVDKVELSGKVSNPLVDKLAQLSLKELVKIAFQDE
jgi:phage terminase small subunit